MFHFNTPETPFNLWFTDVFRGVIEMEHWAKIGYGFSSLRESRTEKHLRSCHSSVMELLCKMADNQKLLPQKSSVTDGWHDLSQGTT